MGDPVHELAHDHADINQRVRALASLVRQRAASSADSTESLARPLRDLREVMFLHFAREEEGLFPFVAETVPELAERVHEMAVAHDTICGALARMVHLASADGDRALLASLYERFEQAYSSHAKLEGELLQKLDAVLDRDHRARLAVLVEGL